MSTVSGLLYYDNFPGKVIFDFRGKSVPPTVCVTCRQSGPWVVCPAWSDGEAAAAVRRGAAGRPAPATGRLEGGGQEMEGRIINILPFLSPLASPLVSRRNMAQKEEIPGSVKIMWNCFLFYSVISDGWTAGGEDQAEPAGGEAGGEGGGEVRDQVACVQHSYPGQARKRERAKIAGDKSEAQSPQF